MYCSSTSLNSTWDDFILERVFVIANVSDPRNFRYMDKIRKSSPISAVHTHGLHSTYAMETIRVAYWICRRSTAIVRATTGSIFLEDVRGRLWRGEGVLSERIIIDGVLTGLDMDTAATADEEIEIFSPDTYRRLS